MIAAWVPALLGLVAGDFAWPAAQAVDRRALMTMPSPERPAMIERLCDRYGAAAVADDLPPLLEEDAPEVRAYAGRLLARAGDPRAATAALAWLTTPGRPPADRTLALDMLSWMPALTPPVRRAIEQAIRDRDPTVRVHALEALRRQRVSPSLSVVIGALDDQARDVRAQAISLLAQAASEDPTSARKATVPLLERLDEPDRGLRLAALRALGRLADPRTIPALTRFALEQTIDLRTAAVDALGAPELAAAVPTLVDLARRRPADRLARHADLALGAIATPAAVAALVAALRLPPIPEEVRFGLRRAGAAAVEPLAEEVARGTPASAAVAAALLGQLGDRRATEALATAADARTGGAAVVLVAIAALARLNDPAGVPALARAAGAPLADVRVAALTALRTIADPRTEGLIRPGLADADPRVRAAACALAAVVGGSTDAPPLAARLADVDPTVRTAAAAALARLAARPPGLLTRMLDTLAGAAATTRQPDERVALGDAFEAVAAAADAPLARLATAFLTAPPPLQAPLARALAAAHLRQPLASREVVDRALALLTSDDAATALAAADALAGAQLSGAQTTTLARAFAEAAPAVRARLCAAIARAPHGGDWLASLLGAVEQPTEVRAAAAWAARALPDARDALARAAHGPDGPLARNARAALAAGGTGRGGWAAVRLLTDDGTPLVGRWVTLAAGSLAIEVETDPTGVARVAGLPAGAIWRAGGL